MGGFLCVCFFCCCFLKEGGKGKQLPFHQRLLPTEQFAHWSKGKRAKRSFRIVFNSGSLAYFGGIRVILCKLNPSYIILAHARQGSSRGNLVLCRHAFKIGKNSRRGAGVGSLWWRRAACRDLHQTTFLPASAPKCGTAPAATSLRGSQGAVPEGWQRPSPHPAPAEPQGALLSSILSQ